MRKFMKIKYLFSFIPISIILYLCNIKLLCFVFTVFSIIPLSTTLCAQTDVLSKKLGDKIGGMINATMANIPELIICLFALKSGMYDLVEAGLIGSIIGNMLLVQGLSIFLGGLRYNEQSFNKNIAKTNFGLLFLALAGIIIVSIYKSVSSFSNHNIDKLSLGIAFILLGIYILGLIFSLITHRNLFVVHPDEDFETTEVNINLLKTLIVLIFVSCFIVIESNILVEGIQYISGTFHISQNFLGIIIVPLVGNVAESMTAVIMSLKNRVSLCIEIAVGSGMQIALFVMPILTIIGFLIAKPISLVFNIYHITSLIISISLSFFVFQDGKTYWIEGTLLLASYFMIALGYYFM